MHRHLHVLTLWACLVLGLLLPPAQADVTHLPPQTSSACSGLPTRAPLVAENVLAPEVVKACADAGRGLPVGYVYYVQERRASGWETVGCSTHAQRRSPDTSLPAADRLQDVYAGLVLCEADTLLTWKGARVVVRTVSQAQGHAGQPRENLLLGEFSRLTLTAKELLNQGGEVTLYAEPGLTRYRIATGRKGEAVVTGTVVRVEVEDMCTGEGYVSVVDQGDEAIHSVELVRPGRVFDHKVTVGEGEVWASRTWGIDRADGEEELARVASGDAALARLAPVRERAREEQQAVPALWHPPPQGEIALTVEPREAQLWVDGVPQPLTGGRVTLELPTGARRVHAELEGYVPFDGAVVIREDVQKETIRLVPIEAPRAEAAPPTPAPKPPSVAEASEAVATPAQDALQGEDPELAKRRDAIGMVLIDLPAGTFMMGSKDGDSDEKPVHPVTLSAFRMSKTEITVAQYRACVVAGVCRAPGMGSDCNFSMEERDTHPINCLDFDQATTFAQWVGGALPTEAQWEYAARGQAGRKYPWGDWPAPDCRLAVYGGSTCGNSSTASACSRPNGNTPEGLCDMAGNVWEWTADWYDGKRYATVKDGATDPTSPAGPFSYRAVRGGSWDDGAGRLRGSNRGGGAPSGHYFVRGFRVVLPPSPGEALE